MKTISVSYDLRQPGRDYEPVYAYLKSTGNWCHALESFWLIRTTKSAVEVRDDLLALIDANDQILCADVTNSAMAWHGLGAKKSEWIRGPAAA